MPGDSDGRAFSNMVRVMKAAIIIVLVLVVAFVAVVVVKAF